MTESQNMPQMPKPSLYETVDLACLNTFPHGLQPRFALPPVSKFANISFTEAFKNKTSESAQQVVLELQTHMPNIDKRTNHAIQYLKRKGLYHTNMYDILEKHCQDIGVDTTTAMLTSIVDGLCEYASRREVTQETYEKAIELTMVQCELDKFIEPDLYSMFLQQHLGILYANVILLAYANEVAQRADKLDDHVQFIAKWIREGHRTEELLKIMQDGNSHSEEAYNERLMKQAEKHNQLLAQAEEKYKDTISALRQESRELRKATQPLQKENKKLNKKLEAETARAAALAERVKELEAALAEKDRFASNLLESSNDDIQVPLPETGIVIVGGHGTLTNALKTKHPDWKYVGPDNKKSPSFPNVDCIFIIGNYVKHSVIEHVRRTTPSKTPMIYLNFRSVERTEIELQQAYTALANSRKASQTDTVT